MLLLLDGYKILRFARHDCDGDLARPTGWKRNAVNRLKDLTVFGLRVCIAIDVHGKSAGRCDGRLTSEEVKQAAFFPGDVAID